MLSFDAVVRNICGPSWRTLPKPDLDAAWGIAIVKAVLNGTPPRLSSLSDSLRVEPAVIEDAYRRLDLNNVFAKMVNDRAALVDNDQLAWGYYGGYACGAIGVGST